MKGESIEISFSESKELQKISALLRNNDLYSNLHELFQTEIEEENKDETIEDSLDLLSFINNNFVNFDQININEKIQFLSKHFYSIEESKIFDLPTEIFYLILKNENLIVESEDSLLNIINSFFNKKKKMVRKIWEKLV